MLLSVFSLVSSLRLTQASSLYSGDQLLSLSVTSRDQADLVTSLRGHDLWSAVSLIRPVVIHCTRDQCPELKSLLRDHGIRFSVEVEDLAAIAGLYPMKPSTVNASKVGHSMSWDDWHTMEDMYTYLDYLAATFPWVTVESLGQSFEGQDMRVAKVCRGEAGCGEKPAMWVDGGIHAREWISPAVNTFLLRELVENDAAHPELTQELDWYFLPVVNPDGYRYSWGTERYWRKTRTENEPWVGTGICMGTDANRNYDFHWGDPGASTDPCDDAFMGSEAFSEVENRNLRDFVLEHRDNIKFFNTLHSYGRMVLLPWGYTEAEPANYDDLYALGMAGAEALQSVHGTTYDVGCIPCLLYPASGGSIDWAYGVAEIPYSMAMELRDNQGWSPDPSQIIPEGEEVWAFHEVAARWIMEEFGAQETTSRQP